ncbi:MULTISPECIES: hypothetical protein [Pantoea]|uniref:hypothetical protein n=1 Tax=Pantoea TaxID=53335 RepID=UPI001F470A00|nr:MULTISPECIES: hypothetical protein [Pantoea]UIL54392.1 hypothetical protein LZU96_02020 [Pantoea agglomerans]
MMINAINISRISTTRRRFGSRCFKTDIKIGKLPNGSIINNNNMVAEIISVIRFTPSCVPEMAVISYAAEKVSVIELIHLPESLHFVELVVTGKSYYYAERRAKNTSFSPLT